MAGVNFMLILLTKELLGQESKSMIIYKIYNDGHCMQITNIVSRVI